MSDDFERMRIYKDALDQVLKQLASPPKGWFVFGHHMDQPKVDLEFWGDDGGGLPIWERPKLEESELAKRLAEIRRTPNSIYVGSPPKDGDYRIAQAMLRGEI